MAGSTSSHHTVDEYLGANTLPYALLSSPDEMMFRDHDSIAKFTVIGRKTPLLIRPCTWTTCLGRTYTFPPETIYE